MQKELRDLFRTIWKGNNLIHITNDDLEALVGRGTTTLMADFQTEYNRQGAFKALCNCVQQKLMAGRGRGHADRLLIYIDMPDGYKNLKAVYLFVGKACGFELKWLSLHDGLRHGLRPVAAWPAP